MARKKDRGGAEVNSGSMADIAFLLLVFFLVTTTIPNEKGLMMQLPAKPDPNIPPPVVEQHDRNIFKISINSADKLLVEDEPLNDVRKLKDMTKEFVMNNGRDPKLSVNPQKAIVSLKGNRGSSYEMYIQVLDQLQGAYYEIWGKRVGLTGEQFRNLDRSKPDQLELYERGKEGINMQISIAQPSK